MFAAELRALTGDMLSACEVMSRRCIEVVEKHVPVRPPFAAPPPWSLLFTVAGFTAGANEVVEGLLERALSSGAATDAAIADSSARESDLWRLRESISPAQRKERAVLAHDISVPIGRLADFMRNAAAIVEELVPKAQICAFGHIGDGNIHYNLSPAVGSDGSTFKEASALLSNKLHDLAVHVGGSFSAEHGVGQLRKQELLRYRGGVEVEMMRTVKRALDPQGIMNPGKIL
jgi:FAD/FMN-containing dehydrogenase